MFDDVGVGAVSGGGVVVGGEVFGGLAVCGDGVGETGVLDFGEGEGAVVGGEEDCDRTVTVSFWPKLQCVGIEQMK